MRTMLVVSILLVTLASTCWGGNARQLTHPPLGSSDVEAVYSPRGDKVAFGRVQQGVGWVPAFFVVDVATGVEDSLVTGLPAGFAANGGMAWSPDGQQIAFNADKTSGGGSALWIADVPDPVVPKVLAITEADNSGRFFALASDGTIFRVDLNGNGQISSAVFGNLFGGAAPSPILSAARGDAGGLMATLQNGDVWQWIANSNQGVMVGNIFVTSGITGVSALSSTLPSHMAAARPNPFNPDVAIDYTVETVGRVSLRVFDVSGRLVRTLVNKILTRGQYTSRWDGKTDNGGLASSGTYFCELVLADGSPLKQKITLLR